MDRTQKLLKRIRGLLRQSEGEAKAGNEKAAEAFALKAQEMLTKHKLELLDVERLEEDEHNPLMYELVDPSLWGELERNTRGEYTEDLAATIAKTYFCRVLIFPESNKLMFVGRKSDIAVSKYVTASVMRKALIACDIELAKIVLSLVSGDMSPGAATQWERTGGNDEFRFSFFSGFNTRIATRLIEQKIDLNNLPGASTALVKVEKEVDDYLNSLNPDKLEDMPERRVIMNGAYHRGAEEGDKANLSANGLNDNNNNLLGE